MNTTILNNNMLRLLKKTFAAVPLLCAAPLLFYSCQKPYHTTDKPQAIAPEIRYDGRNPFLHNAFAPDSATTDTTLSRSNNEIDPNAPEQVYAAISPTDTGFCFLPDIPSTPIPVHPEDIIYSSDSLYQIVSTRLNVLLDAPELSLNRFAIDFKAAYPQPEYRIIYADPILKQVQIECPADQRQQIQNDLLSELPSKYTAKKVLIYEECIFTKDSVPNDPRIDECWYHDAIGTYKAWDYTQGSPDIIVAIVDDGCETRCNEFAGRIHKPYNVFSRTDDVYPSPDQHGTHVSGLALAASNNNAGIAGVAPKCQLMPVKVFDDNGFCTTTSVLDGVLYAVYNGADVVNLSLGMSFHIRMTEEEQEILTKNLFKKEERLWNKVFSIARKNNAVVVLAAGNDALLAGIDPIQRSNDIIVVAAVDQDTAEICKAEYSNYGRYTKVSAPGSNMLSTIGKDEYGYKSGTSMAAPLVTGTVALMKSINRALSPKQIRSILRQTGVPAKGRVGKMIQADKAVRRAKNTTPDYSNSHPTPTEGMVQVLLEWDNYNDLDLYVKEPTGEIIWFRNRLSSSGGELEIDMNNGIRAFSASPIENIYWRKGMAPKGTYEVYVSYYKRHDNYHSASPYKITVKYGDTKRYFKGNATPNSELFTRVCTFEYK